MNHAAGRMSYIFLCLVPVLSIALTAMRNLRVSGVYQTIGVVLFTAIIAAGWIVGARAIRSGTEVAHRLVLAGGFLLTPFALISLLWVGLGPPWEATPTQNVMRYIVLLVSSLAVAVGFIVLKELLSEAGERYYSPLGFAATVLGGSAYLVWMSFLIGANIAKVRDGHVPPEIASMNDVLGILLFVACLLTYLATAAFAASFGRTWWLGRRASRAYVATNLIASFFLVLGELSAPDPTSVSTPWYASPGFIAGIPAVPFIMPFLLGVVLLRRAGDEPSM